LTAGRNAQLNARGFAVDIGTVRSAIESVHLAFAFSLAGTLGSCSADSRPPSAPDRNGRDAASPIDADGDATDASETGDDNEASDAPDGAGSFAATSIAVGSRHACALTQEGGVRCWGDNRSGQLGDGTTTQRRTPVFVSGLTSGVVAIAAGDVHTCALNNAGGVLCWGSNLSGAVGDGSTAAQRNSPVPVSGLASGVMAIAAGGADTCAALAAGNTVCWGQNVSGQLGDGSTTSRSTPAATVGVIGGVATIPIAMAPGGDHTCMIAVGGSVICSGDDANGALGNGGNASTMSYVASGVTSDAVAVAAGNAVSCALLSDGSVQCWGFGGHGTLGTGSTMPTNIPVPVAGLAPAAGIAVGTNHACAVTTGGAVLCWGDNSGGQLGDGTTLQRTTPVAVPALAAGVGAIAASGGTCALTTTGSVYCWGPNANGEVGDGSTSERDTPVPVSSFP
jgi:alpha-tubulin suppressor-like RCC1 family protein